MINPNSFFSLVELWFQIRPLSLLINKLYQQDSYFTSVFLSIYRFNILYFVFLYFLWCSKKIILNLFHIKSKFQSQMVLYQPAIITNTKRFNWIVIYWPSTEPSIKRCTCVNKWKNSWIRWTLENDITRCSGCLSQLETGCRSEDQLQDWY